jgi:DNA ligase (NAD+)
MDIEGLGDKLVDQLVDAGLVRTPADLYKLGVAKLAALERMAEKVGVERVAAIEKSKETTLAPLHLRARHPQRGRGDGEGPARAFRHARRAHGRTLEQLQDAPDVGPVVAESIARVLRREAQPRGGRAAARRRRALEGEPPARRPAERALRG